MAFEQGKTLPHAELVPFRLTRDVVDGMGLEGVEGVFLRCCEETLRVMRSSQENLLTIVEVRTASVRSAHHPFTLGLEQVLLHDPLHLWTISPSRALTMQQQRHGADDYSGMPGAGSVMPDANGTTNGLGGRFNKLAERTLLR